MGDGLLNRRLDRAGNSIVAACIVNKPPNSLCISTPHMKRMNMPAELKDLEFK